MLRERLCPWILRNNNCHTIQLAGSKRKFKWNTKFWYQLPFQKATPLFEGSGHLQSHYRPKSGRPSQKATASLSSVSQLLIHSYQWYLNIIPYQNTGKIPRLFMLRKNPTAKELGILKCTHSYFSECDIKKTISESWLQSIYGFA